MGARFSVWKKRAPLPSPFRAVPGRNRNRSFPRLNPSKNAGKKPSPPRGCFAPPGRRPAHLPAFPPGSPAGTQNFRRDKNRRRTPFHTLSENHSAPGTESHAPAMTAVIAGTVREPSGKRRAGEPGLPLRPSCRPRAPTRREVPLFPTGSGFPNPNSEKRLFRNRRDDKNPCRGARDRRFFPFSSGNRKRAGTGRGLNTAPGFPKRGWRGAGKASRRSIWRDDR